MGVIRRLHRIDPEVGVRAWEVLAAARFFAAFRPAGHTTSRLSRT